METFSSSVASQLIKAALDSKAITLNGPLSGATPTEAGKKDAEYLKALLTALQEQTP